MRILAISDKIVPTLYGPSLKQVVGQVELILSCGDLPAYYIDYISSALGVPCYFVHGNHASGAEFEEPNPFEPRRVHFMDIDNRVVAEKGLLLAGLDGSIRYNANPRFQYTQNEMWLKVLRLTPSLLWNRLAHGRSLDVLIAHSPPAGIHDGPDRPHLGFASFLWLMRAFKPRYLLHGHKHVYRNEEVTITQFRDTTVINVYPWRIIEL
jgi:Icc-related predicted phosphoesterase